MANWFYSQGGQTRGPLSKDDLLALAVSGALKPGDLVWQEEKGRNVGSAAAAVIDFAMVARSRQQQPEWIQDVAQVEEARGPLIQPLVPTQEVPTWLNDMRLWYGLEITPTPPSVPLPPPVAPTPPPSPAPPALAVALPPSAPAAEPLPVALPVAKFAPPRKTTHVPTAKQPTKVKPLPPAVSPSAIPVVATQPPPIAANTAATMEASPSAVDILAKKALAETGFDLRTGLIVDAARFREWKKQQAETTTPNNFSTNASLMEVFRQARIAVERWVDDEANRRLIMKSKFADIVNSPQLEAVLEPFVEYGPVMKEKLLKHLDFMVENRRSYYSACPG
ncbi:MAG TPA: GYF domain-containing protein [Gemmataceae bacterium]|nr:GYF domain-containing protein [Gemmataceae bacterium]